MGNDQISPFLNSLRYNGFCRIQTAQHTSDFSIGIACDEPRIIVTCLLNRRSYLFEVLNNVANLH